MGLLSFLDKDRSVAGPGYNRWLAPPAALAVHLSIGQVYAMSVFKDPLTRVLGVARPGPGDWSPDRIAWIFSIAIAVLGLSTAVFGKWLERNGPRKAIVIAAGCFGLGFVVAAVGVHFHQLWLVYLGYGGIGGIGLGLGYLAPVGNLVRWFNDRPGLATGMAIMGFGGGAMIGSPLATLLMTFFQVASHGGYPAAFGSLVHAPAHPLAGATTVGVGPTFVVMGAVYFAFILFGGLLTRTPPPGWNPGGKATGGAGGGHGSATAAGANVDVAAAVRTPAFWLLWLVLCLNTTAGISIIEQASPLIRDLFGHDRVTLAAAAGYVGLISLFNMGGRFVWSSLSDYVGRRATFAGFFVVGAAGYAAIPFTGARHLDSIVAFVAVTGLLLSFYGGGFSTMPAYVRDLFGTKDLNAIYGRILTAWSVAGVLGPTLVNQLVARQQAHGVPPADAYRLIFYVMAALLAAGLACDLLIRRPTSVTAPESRP